MRSIKPPPNPARLTGLIQATAKAEGKHPSRVSVEFVSPEAIADLNRKYREKSQPTDVLSFPFDGSFPQGSGGQIIICREEATKGAATHGRLLDEELERLVIHGMLHLLGYTDDTPEELAAMEQKTDRIIEEYRG